MGLCNDQRKSGCYVFNGLVISAVSLAMIIIGGVNIRKDWDPEQAPEDVAAEFAKNACETMVPAWHIVGGFMILTGLLLRVILAKVNMDKTHTGNYNLPPYPSAVMGVALVVMTPRVARLEVLFVNLVSQ